MTKTLDWAMCENCGSDCIQVETDATIEGHVYDGDTLTCLECGERGWCSVDEGIATDYWHVNS